MLKKWRGLNTFWRHCMCLMYSYLCNFSCDTNVGLYVSKIYKLLLANALHMIGSFSQASWVFLTGYKWRQTHRGCNGSRPYRILRHMVSMSEELSTCTFWQPTRLVGLTNIKSTSLRQSTLPHGTNLDRFYFVREINIPNIVWDSCGMW
jgi:hypothetical protein